ncbi:hypothetical protein J8F10_28160 [Gemmata sp. G18]|uniref:Uncharacterized protein n=1 Tax=Gemmata palustris TaxID=2822762 RepID=A0ABS5BZI2_9BACT|nr:hypothetical protein [Gemmata palustris]MBP3959137.1 hypothetical protein [Gemmata palustris]
MDANEFLFSTATLAVLNAQQYDPGAKGAYEYLSGGLMWPDERPEAHEPGREFTSTITAYRCLIASRAAITLGKETGVWPVWEQVLREASNWPGLRPERWGEAARKRLLAAKRREARCFDELERQLEEQLTSGTG